MIRGDAARSVNVPLSAFAARKAKKVPSEDASKKLEPNRGGNGGLCGRLDEFEEDQPTRPKKRKREVRAPSRSTQSLSLRELDTTPAINVSGPVEADGLQRSVSSSPSTTHPSVDASALDDGELYVGGSDVGGSGQSSSDAEVAPRKIVPVRQLSIFSPSERNILGDNKEGWTLRLREHDTLAIVGQYDLWVRRGAVNIMGATLHASPKLHRVYAPSTHSLPVIRYARNPYGPANQPVEIAILSCRSQLRLLRRLSWRFAKIWNRNPSKTGASVPGPNLLRSFGYLASSADDPLERPLHCLDIRPDWQSLITQLAVAESPKPLAVMVCGPKNSGKSTFSRYLANSILVKTTTRVQGVAQDKSVAVLDLDPGQPEFSPPGEISLLRLRSCNFGTPYAHPVVPPGSRLIRAHHVGAVSPKEDPDHYLECVLDLVVRYRRMLASHPSCCLIVNCSGWVLGSGLEVLVELINNMALTAVVYMSTTGPAEVVDTLMEASRDSKTPFHALSSQPTEHATRTAADLRAMQTLSYFHLDEPEGENLRWNARPLAEVPPLVVKYAGVKQVIFGVMILGELLDPNCLATVLDGSVVGVVAIEDDSALTLEDRRNRNSFGERISDDDIEERLGLSNDTVQDHSGMEQLAATTGDPTDAQIEQDHERTLQYSRRQHPDIHRTTVENLPYFTAANGACTPLDPSKCRSLGQALVRYIDQDSHALHLITPIPLDTISCVHQRKKKIVLVRGKLDTPTWAYQEDLQRMRKRMEIAGELDLSGWDEGFPWLKEVTGKNNTRKGGKVWRVRRNLKTHGSGPDRVASE